MLRTLTALVLWATATASIGVAQAGAENLRATQNTPGNCETNASDLNTVAKEALSRNGDEVVIAIARLGSGETSRTHNQRRLRAVERGLVMAGLPVQRIVLAKSERVKGYGRVELYAAGKLRMALLANPNKAICTECCDAARDPPREQKRRR